MEKLIKPAAYATSNGISRQAVYAQIKRGALIAKSVEGQLYIIVDSNETIEDAKETIASEVIDKETKRENSVTEETTNNQKKKIRKRVKKRNLNTLESLDGSRLPYGFEALLEAKDETISVLKGTVKSLKTTNKQMSTTLRGEIGLLKEAFHEMRTLYIGQIRQIRHEKPLWEESVTDEGFKREQNRQKPINQDDTIDITLPDEYFRESKYEQNETHESQKAWIGLKKFFRIHNITEEERQEAFNTKIREALQRGDRRILYKDGKIKLKSNVLFDDMLIQA